MANSVWIGYLGPTQVTSDGSGIVFPGTVTATRFLSGDGTVAAPAFAPSAESTTGLFFAASRISVSFVSTERYRFEPFTFTLSQATGIAWGSSGLVSPDVTVGRAAPRTITLGPTTGVTLRWATDGQLEVRNFANSAAANISVNNAVAVQFQATSSYLNASAGAYYWASRSVVTAPADGQMNLSNNASTLGIGLDFATDAILKVRTRAQTGYATVDCLGLSASGVAGASFSGAVTNITVVNGIVTAAS